METPLHYSRYTEKRREELANRIKSKYERRNLVGRMKQ